MLITKHFGKSGVMCKTCSTRNRSPPFSLPAGQRLRPGYAEDRYSRINFPGKILGLEQRKESTDREDRRLLAPDRLLLEFPHANVLHQADNTEKQDGSFSTLIPEQPPLSSQRKFKQQRGGYWSHAIS